MWFPSEQDAVEMFAAHFEARHRSGAVVKAKDIARRLQQNGDQEGFLLWEAIADTVSRIRAAPRVNLRRELERA